MAFSFGQSICRAMTKGTALSGYLFTHNEKAKRAKPTLSKTYVHTRMCTRNLVPPDRETPAFSCDCTSSSSMDSRMM